MNKATFEFLSNLVNFDKNSTTDGMYHIDYLDELLLSRQGQLASHIGDKDKFIDRLTRDYEFYVTETRNIFQQISELKHFRYALIKEFGDGCLPNKMTLLNEHIDKLETRLSRYKNQVDIFEQPGYIEKQYQTELQEIMDGIYYCINHKKQQAIVEQEVYLIKKILRCNYAEEFDK